ncbi:S24 family peptidase [Serratia sp. CY33525]|uniref:S24 family peptidase n=1 Tax=Serratia sp. CY33525 TaxID=3383602 RepID=UPI003FA1090D
MVTKNELREKFAERLKLACDEAGVRLHGRAVDIKAALKKRGISVTTTAVGKWLNAESSPEGDRIVALSEWLGVRAEWLEYGRGNSRDSAVISLDDDGDDGSYAEPVDDDELVELPLLDVRFSAGDGTYDMVEKAASTFTFRRQFLHEMGVSTSAAKLVKISGSSMEPRLQDGDIVGINTDDTRIREGKTYAIRHGNLLRVKVLIEHPDGGVTIRSLNKDEYGDEHLSYQQRKEQLVVLGRVFWSSSAW